MKRLIVAFVLVVLAVSLHSEEEKARRFYFNFSAGYTLSRSTDHVYGCTFARDQIRDQIGYKTIDGFHVSLSMIRNTDARILLEPGIRYITRGWGEYRIEPRHQYGVWDEYLHKMHHLDLFCKIKYNTERHFGNSALHWFPYVGFSYSFLVYSREEYDLNIGDFDRRAVKLPKNDVENFLLIGMDFVYANRITFGVEYGRAITRIPIYQVTKIYLQSLSISVGVRL